MVALGGRALVSWVGLRGERRRVAYLGGGLVGYNGFPARARGGGCLGGIVEEMAWAGDGGGGADGAGEFGDGGGEPRRHGEVCLRTDDGWQCWVMGFDAVLQQQVGHNAMSWRWRGQLKGERGRV